MRKHTDPEEMNTHKIGAYVMVAFAKLGGRCRGGKAGEAPVLEEVHSMLKDRFKPCDWRKLYNGPDGIDWAPDGYPDEDTFPVWENNASLSWKFAVIRGFVRNEDKYKQLTPSGYQYVFGLAEKCLAGGEESI